MTKFHLVHAAALLASFCLAGCASYTTPGRGANLEVVGAPAAPAATVAARATQTDGTIQQAMDRKPLASFPTGIAVVRIQAPCYRSATAEGWGWGNYSIVTTRDIETPEQIERLTKLPLVSGVAPLNRLLLPAQLKSDLELRQAAGKLQADMLLVYTLDTTFSVEDAAKPVSVITLGLFPNHKARVVTTASAVLMDTRNGYLYGVAEATDRCDSLASAWSSEHAVDELRRKTESSAFEKLVGELEKTWTGVVNQYAPTRAVR